MDGDGCQTCDNFTIYTNIELFCTPETNVNMSITSLQKLLSKNENTTLYLDKAG